MFNYHIGKPHLKLIICLKNGLSNTEICIHSPLIYIPLLKISTEEEVNGPQKIECLADLSISVFFFFFCDTVLEFLSFCFLFIYFFARLRKSQVAGNILNEPFAKS